MFCGVLVFWFGYTLLVLCICVLGVCVVDELISVVAPAADEGSPASKRFRTLIQELFSLVHELYEENDKLGGHAKEVEELKSQNEVLRDALLWLGSSELIGDTPQKLKVEIRKKVSAVLGGMELED